MAENANARLDKDIKDANGSIKEHSSRADKAQAQLDAANAALQDNAAAAAKYYDAWMKSEAALKKEKHKSNSMRGEKDKAIRVATAQAKKGKSIIKSIQDVVNSTIDCRQCGADLYFKLNVDDRVIQQPKTEPRLLMLRCSCGTKKYGRLVE